MKFAKTANLKIQNIGAANSRSRPHITSPSITIGSVLATAILSTFATADSLSKDNIQIINESVTAIKAHSVHSLDDDSATHAAIQGVIESLDPYSQLMTPEQYKNISTLVLSNTSNLGISFKHSYQGWQIAQIDADSAAAKGGLQEGDTLLAIDETAVSETLINNLNQIIQSKPTTVIDIIRDNKRRRFQINNNDLAQAQVSFKLLDDSKIALIKIPFFVESTPKQVAAILEPLKSQPLNGLIVDLRDNAGGLLSSAVDVADMFLSNGTIVSIQGKHSDPIVHVARDNAHIANTPMIVLINKRTASAAEIVASALKENQRAHIVGQTSFGKGSVQAVVPLSDGYAIKLTTAFYYSPKGHKIDGRGVEPQLTVADLDAPAMTESLLMRYLIKQF